MTRIKLCFDFLISLISSGPRYGVIFLHWHDILFWAMTAVCRRFGDRGKGGGVVGIVAWWRLEIIRLAVHSAAPPPYVPHSYDHYSQDGWYSEAVGNIEESRLVCSVSEQRANESLNVALLLKVHHFSSQVD